MSVGGGAARRYAQAAFDLAKDTQTLDLWEQDLELLKDSFSDPLVQEFFESPVVPEAAKQEALRSILPEDDHQMVRNLVLLLLERKRIDQLPRVVDAFKGLLLEERGIAIADVTTAVDLDPREIELVKRRLREMIGKEVEVRPHVDPSIIGGIVVRVGDTLIDGSVRTQLQLLRQQLAR